MLRLGGYINILIAIGHLVGLLWSGKMFEVTGISEKMNELAQINPLLPYLLTIFVAIVFSVFGLYGLSADNKCRKLPLLKSAIFIIAGVYLFRGIAGLVFDSIKQREYLILGICYSLIAVFIGLLFLIGGLRKWKTKGTV